MFKFFALCLLAILSCAAARTAVVAAPFAYSAYSAYSSPLVAALPYTAEYTASGGLYAAPYAAYSAYPYAAAYSAYPYATLLR